MRRKGCIRRRTAAGAHPGPLDLRQPVPPHLFLVPLLLFFVTISPGAETLEEIPADLEVPGVVAADPAPGLRVKDDLPTGAPNDLYHLLYLPRDWKPDRRYPVIFEYPGNRFREGKGIQEECVLGYGITGGEGAIWVCLPFVDPGSGSHASRWWGDPDATVTYCVEAVERVCRSFGGDRERLFLAGFSRGAIACNFIGLRDDAIASLWRGMICHSHYDGVRRWGYPESDEASAVKRLKRLSRRPQWISHEHSVEDTENYLGQWLPGGDFTFGVLPFREHTADWVLRDLPLRRELREWFRRVSAESMPGKEP